MPSSESLLSAHAIRAFFPFCASKISTTCLEKNALSGGLVQSDQGLVNQDLHFLLMTIGPLSHFISL